MGIKAPKHRAGSGRGGGTRVMCGVCWARAPSTGGARLQSRRARILGTERGGHHGCISCMAKRPTAGRRPRGKGAGQAAAAARPRCGPAAGGPETHAGNRCVRLGVAAAAGELVGAEPCLVHIAHSLAQRALPRRAVAQAAPAAAGVEAAAPPSGHVYAAAPAGRAARLVAAAAVLLQDLRARGMGAGHRTHTGSGSSHEHQQLKTGWV